MIIGVLKNKENFEHLSVLSISKDLKGPILCLAGLPSGKLPWPNLSQDFKTDLCRISLGEFEMKRKFVDMKPMSALG